MSHCLFYCLCAQSSHTLQHAEDQGDHREGQKAGCRHQGRFRHDVHYSFLLFCSRISSPPCTARAKGKQPEVVIKTATRTTARMSTGGKAPKRQLKPKYVSHYVHCPTVANWCV